jgi:hypothetical protein
MKGTADASCALHHIKGYADALEDVVIKRRMITRLRTFIHRPKALSIGTSLYLRPC